jgi:GH15 family glucan-1,4-alpha-glucosidase
VAMRIEDYGLIGDTHTAALVGRNGSIDWLCLPRFDSAACFAGLLGTDDHGYWQIAPKGTVTGVSRRYKENTLVLETEFTTSEGTARVIDCMPIREDHPEVIRLVEGLSGAVEMQMCLAIRLGYGCTIPWVRHQDGLLTALAGPDGLALWTPIETTGKDFQTTAEFTVTEGQLVPFVLSWFPSHEPPPRPTDASFSIAETISWWQAWSSLCTIQGEYRPAALRSLITLKALTYQPTGGIVAAATTSLPETLGGVRNWDYRYCWLRDATLTLAALMRGGYSDEAMAWRDWLLRAVAGNTSELQIMYGPAGERRLDEWEIDWLPGYESSKPVRIGNAAAGQYQLDVYGEVMSALYEASRVGDITSDPAWDLQVSLMEFLESGWKEPDDGIWEVRGPRRHFTHSKVMAWVAVDRAVRSVEEFGFDGPVTKWRKLRDAIHAEVCEKGYNEKVGSFTQYYGSDALDASLLMMPLFGFLPATDPRVRSTIEKIEKDLTEDGFVLRYRAVEANDVDGLTGREGAFLACSFWMADCLSLLGRHDDAQALFERLLGLRNDLGLLSEEYDAIAQRQVGNFPQAFSHVSLVNTACNLTGHRLDDVRPSPETFEAIRRSTMRRSPRSTRSHSILSPSRRHGEDDGQAVGVGREPRRPTKATGAPAPSKRRSD